MSGAETIVMGYFDLKPHMYKSKETGQVKGASGSSVKPRIPDSLRQITHH